MEPVQIPTKMQAVVVDGYREDLDDALAAIRVVERPVPSPGRGEVLVRMAAAPCNPSDLLLLRGMYGVRKTLPMVPGWEGSGTVVRSGGGLLARAVVGKRVACGGQSDGDGTWAEYYVTQARTCIPLPAAISLEQGASFIVNPLTALGLLDAVRRHGATAAMQTAAMSQLGQMLVRLFRQEGIPLISIVRRAEQLDALRALGAPVVLDSTAADFDRQMEQHARELGATIVLDAVGGDLGGRLLNAMPAGSRLVLYGALSETPLGGLDPIEVLFRDKSVEGFYLGTWLQAGGLWRILRATRMAKRLMRDGILTTHVAARVPLAEASAGLAAWVRTPGEGKALLNMGH